ncbi:MAG: GreA/GreB family elongation factor [Verrucomicrobia bacterium]|nr:GreA/GreB family elongation factor [Verrucomicrobiota bacterium]
MNKTALLQAIVQRLESELALLTRAALATYAEATDEQNKAENKYDTRSLEASYLARGQSKVVDEAAQALEQFRALATRDIAPGEPVALGALVTIADATGGNSHYFVGPRAGGIELEHDGRTIMIITPQSPLGRQLVGRREGESVWLERGGKRSEYRIARVV